MGDSSPAPATFANSYVITNRSKPAATSYDSTGPLPGGAMWFYEAPGAYNAEMSAYNPVPSQPGGVPEPSTTPPAAFLSDLKADLQAQGASPQLTVLIHGLGYLFAEAIALLSQAGHGLQQYASYGGLAIAFDWPSYDEFDSGWYYASSPYSFPPTATGGSIRDNINGSTAAFQNLLAMVAGLQAGIAGLQVNFICHSEGNYMLMVGMHGLAPSQTAAKIGQVLLLAADINNGALQLTPDDSLTGQGTAIASGASRVTVYYSANDTVLSGAESAYESFHNPEYLGRLGQVGPASYLDGALGTNVVGLDCSAVVNQQALAKILPPTVTLHASYFYVPQVFEDMAATLDGTPAGQVAHRVGTGIQDGQQYQMQLATQQQAFDVRRAGGRGPAARRPVAGTPVRG